SSTSGYKSDREFYGLYVSADAETQSTLPNIERNWIDFGQGVVKETANPRDVSLSGRGFLTADSPAGPLYTRNGALRLSSKGVLETADGYTVHADTTTGYIQAQLGAGTGNLQILKDGAVMQDGQVLGTLTLAHWPKPEVLEK